MILTTTKNVHVSLLLLKK